MSHEALLELISKNLNTFRENSIVNGRVLEIKNQFVIVDVGYKSEGAIPFSEFEDEEEVNVGDTVEVLLEKLENDEGMIVLSKEKAAHKQNWDKIVKVFHDGGLVKGKVKSVVKGGLMVNVGVEAFLPGSQIDIIPPKDLNEYVGNVYEFKIVKVNDDRKNIVLSRREVIEAERAEQRAQFLETVTIGDTVEGQVKNITDFGAFVDLQGMDGLLHITDMSWGRINHPSEMVMIGQPLVVQILDVDREKERVSLGLKQLADNPWEDIEQKFSVGTEVNGKITKLVPYGAFVEIEQGVEGLIHVSELSWTKRITRPSDVLEVDQEVKAVVLAISKEEQKISLGVRQLEPNPWDEVESRYPIGSTIKGEIPCPQPHRLWRLRRNSEEGIGLRHGARFDSLEAQESTHPSEVLKKGDEVGKRSLSSIDEGQPRVSLAASSLKKIMGSSRALQRSATWSRARAKIASFGAFVQPRTATSTASSSIRQTQREHVKKVKGRHKVKRRNRSPRDQVDKVERLHRTFG
ncbi:UNVERIFIED_CONTAM: hypothetical protein GTU68_063798 [Idotea baltica]|nr:hypothetical protein [Idotea baltica]